MTISATAERVDGAMRCARVVLVDERRLLGDALRIALAERGGMVASACATPGEGVEAARRARPDAVVVHVAGDDDVDTVRELRAALPGTPLLVLADAADDLSVRAAAAAGACGYLTSADDVEAVVTGVRDAIDGRRGVAAHRLDVAAKRAVCAAAAAALTEREREVLARLVRGQSTEKIAFDMGVSRHTARTHIQRVLAKLGAHSRVEAVARAARDQLV